jgi:hypothetical protein
MAISLDIGFLPYDMIIDEIILDELLCQQEIKCCLLFVGSFHLVLIYSLYYHHKPWLLNASNENYKN